jgi:hypothetical protein
MGDHGPAHMLESRSACDPRNLATSGERPKSSARPLPLGIDEFNNYVPWAPCKVD